MHLLIKKINCIDDINTKTVDRYMAYLKMRIAFLLQRFDKHPDFPGIHTGYDSITGEDFDDEFNLPYSWINGRGLCVLTRFEEIFPEYRNKLKAYSEHTLNTLEKQWRANHYHFPFIAEPDGREKTGRFTMSNRIQEL